MLKKKILLAEDDASMRRFVEIILSQAGYDVTTAEDGLKAMQIALETEFQAVVADAIMPNFSGYDLCRTIRAGSSGTEIFCIILSGLSQKQSDKTADIADVFLTKNAGLKEELLAALEKLFSGVEPQKKAD